MEAVRGAKCRELMEIEKTQKYEHIASHRRLMMAHEFYEWKGTECGCIHTEVMSATCGMCPENTVSTLLECQKECQKEFCLGWLLRNAFYFHSDIKDHVAQKWADCVRSVFDLELFVKNTKGMEQLLGKVEKYDKVYLKFEKCPPFGIKYSVCDANEHEILGGISSDMGWAHKDSDRLIRGDIRTKDATVKIRHC